MWLKSSEAVCRSAAPAHVDGQGGGDRFRNRRVIAGERELVVELELELSVQEAEFRLPVQDRVGDPDPVEFRVKTCQNCTVAGHALRSLWNPRGAGRAGTPGNIQPNQSRRGKALGHTLMR